MIISSPLSCLIKTNVGDGFGVDSIDLAFDLMGDFDLFFGGDLDFFFDFFDVLFDCVLRFVFDVAFPDSLNGDFDVAFDIVFDDTIFNGDVFDVFDDDSGLRFAIL